MADLDPGVTQDFLNMYAFVRGGEDRAPAEKAPVVVFGRNDERVAERVFSLVKAGLAEVIVITGGVGKDTGDLLDRGYRSEAHFLEEVLRARAAVEGVDLPPVLLDEQARNGGENARNSLDLLSENGYLGPNRRRLIAAVHATSAVRLAATLELEAQKRSDCPDDIAIDIAATAYPIDAETSLDRLEIAGEIGRIAAFSQTGFGVPQPGIDPYHVALSRIYLESQPMPA